MSSHRDQGFLSDIHEALRRIRSYAESHDFASFVLDEKTQDAVIRNLEILGEASKNLSNEFRAEHPHIPWKSMAATRDRLIHHYFGVNLDIVWEIITEALPDLEEKLASIPELDG